NPDRGHDEDRFVHDDAEEAQDGGEEGDQAADDEDVLLGLALLHDLADHVRDDRGRDRSRLAGGGVRGRLGGGRGRGGGGRRGPRGQELHVAVADVDDARAALRALDLAPLELVVHGAGGLARRTGELDQGESLLWGCLHHNCCPQDLTLPFDGRSVRKEPIAAAREKVALPGGNPLECGRIPEELPMMNRRDLLKAAAIGAAASWLPAWRREEKIRLGVASYSLRKFKRAQAIEMVKACETPYVNIKSFHLPYTLKGEELVAARKEFDDAGLKVVGSGNNSLKNEKEIAELFEYAKAARFPLLVIAPEPDLLPKIEEAVKKSGIPVAIHNHGPEDKIFPAPSDALKRIKDMDPRVGLCVDVGHTTRTGKDVVQEIADAGARVLDLHIKDLKDLMNKNSQ